THCSVGDQVLDGLARVVRHGEGRDERRADAESLARADFPDLHPFEHLSLVPERRQAAVRNVDGGAVRGGEVEDAAGMVAVLVRHEDGIDLPRLEAQPGEAPLRVAQLHAAVDEDARGARALARFGEQRVAPASAAERSEAEQRYLSCSCRRPRMRCTVGEASLAPSLLRTFTTLRSSPCAPSRTSMR